MIFILCGLVAFFLCGFALRAFFLALRAFSVLALRAFWAHRV
jgi:hypothetical protein